MTLREPSLRFKQTFGNEQELNKTFFVKNFDDENTKNQHAPHPCKDTSEKEEETEEEEEEENPRRVPGRTTASDEGVSAEPRGKERSNEYLDVFTIYYLLGKDRRRYDRERKVAKVI